MPQPREFMRPTVTGVLLSAIVLALQTEQLAWAAPRAVPNPCYAAAKEVFGHESATVGKDASAPTLIFRVEPELPKREPPIHGTGHWVGSVLIGTDGNVNKVWTIFEPRFTPPCPECVKGFSDAILKWKYTPTVVDGTPVPLCIAVVVRLERR